MEAVRGLIGSLSAGPCGKYGKAEPCACEACRAFDASAASGVALRFGIGCNRRRCRESCDACRGAARFWRHHQALRPCNHFNGGKCQCYQCRSYFVKGQLTQEEREERDLCAAAANLAYKPDEVTQEMALTRGRDFVVVQTARHLVLSFSGTVVSDAHHMSTDYYQIAMEGLGTLTSIGAERKARNEGEEDGIIAEALELFAQKRGEAPDLRRLVTGHSLGGFRAARAKEMQPELFHGGHIFNAGTGIKRNLDFPARDPEPVSTGFFNHHVADDWCSKGNFEGWQRLVELKKEGTWGSHAMANFLS